MKNKKLRIELLVIEMLLVVVLLTTAVVTKELCAQIKKTNETVNDMQKALDDIKNNGVDTEYTLSSFEEIQANHIESRSKGKKIIVFLGRSTCGYCTSFAPILGRIQENYNVEILYIDMAKILDYEGTTEDGVLCKDADKILTNLKTNEKGKTIMENYGATPILLVIKDNKIIGGQVGYSEYENMVSFIEEEGFKEK